MFGISVDFESHVERVTAAADRAAKRVHSIVAFEIRKAAIGSIIKAEGPSDPGEPPHTHRRQFLKRAVIYAADKDGAVIGPRHSAVGTSSQVHEFGGERFGAEYPERPFMSPALERNIDRFAGEWRGSIGE